MAMTAGQAIVKIGADNSALTAGLKQAQQSLNAFAGQMERAGLALVAIGTGVLAPLGAALKSFTGYGDELNKLHDATGSSVGDLAKLRWAAEQSAVPFETLRTALYKMRQQIGSGALGGKLGAELNGKGALEQFAVIADAFGSIENDAQKAAAAVQVFGRGGQQLLPFIKMGREGMAVMAAEASRLGLAISPEDAAAATALGDAWNKMKAAVQGVSFEAARIFAADLAKLADGLAEAVAGARKFVSENQQLIKYIAAGAAACVGFGGALLALGAGVKTLSFALGGISLAAKTAAAVIAPLAGLLASPFALAVAGAVGFAVAIRDCSDAAREFSDDVAGGALGALKSAFGAVADYIGELWSELTSWMSERLTLIWNALKSGDVEAAFAVIWNSGKQVFADVAADAIARFIDIRYAIADNILTVIAKVKNAFISAWDYIQMAAVDVARGIVSAFDKIGAVIATNLISGIRAAMNFVLGEGAFEQQFGQLETFANFLSQFAGRTPELDKTYNSLAEQAAKHRAEAEKEYKAIADGAKQAGEEAKSSGLAGWLKGQSADAEEALRGLRRQFANPIEPGSVKFGAAGEWSPADLTNRLRSVAVGTTGGANALRALEGANVSIQERTLSAMKGTEKNTAAAAQETRELKEKIDATMGAIVLE